MATHSSVLAWRIPGTGEPGGLPSMGSHRVGHDWSDLAAAAMISDVAHLFVNLLAICISICSDPLLIFKLDSFLLSCCMSSLYILDINCLSNIWFTNIVSHSGGCLFMLLLVSFVVQRLFRLMQSHLFISAFVAFAFGVTSKKSSLRQMSWVYCLYFLLGVLWLQVIHSSL